MVVKIILTDKSKISYEKGHHTLTSQIDIVRGNPEKSRVDLEHLVSGLTSILLFSFPFSLTSRRNEIKKKKENRE